MTKYPLLVVLFSFPSFMIGQTAYSAVGDFGIKSNPNGVWSYLGSGTPFTSAATGTGGNTGLVYWSNNGGLSNFNGIFANVSGKTVNVSDVSIVPDHLDMSANIGNVAVRFTAPAAGTWSVTGDFLGIEAHTELAHNVAILVNGVSAFSGNIAAVSQSAPFNLALTLKLGDLVDFVNYAGSTVTYTNTGLAATVASNPYTVNGASFQTSAPIAPASIASAFGTHLATQTTPATLPLGTILGGTSVTVIDANGASAPAELLYVSATQVNFLVPSGLASGTGQIRITAGDGTIVQGAVQIVNIAPGVFTADGTIAVGSILQIDAQGNQTSQFISQYNGTIGVFQTIPIKLSSTVTTVLTLYGTGLRNGSASQSTVKLGNQSLTPTYAGIQPTFVGLDQINVQIPNSLAGSGDTTLTFSSNGLTSNAVHIAIQ